MSTLAPGLLVAAPPLADPNFDKSVVLLASHGREGAFGWVINGQELMTVPELLIRAEITEKHVDALGRVRVGGPVSPDQVWLLYQRGDGLSEIEGQFPVGDGITATASRKVLEAIAQGEHLDGLTALVGYAGWGPDQLEAEIGAGAWLPTDIDLGIVFDTPRDRVWHRCYELLGATPIAFTSRFVGSA